MKINYSTVANEQLASYRYRIKIPGMILSDWGHEVVVGKPQQADVGVFSKHFNAQDYEIARQPTRYRRVVFDVCDYHLDGPHRDHYERMVHLADEVIVGTDEMGIQIAREFERKTITIPDPYEFEEQEPEFRDGLRILWFGHASNLKPLLFEIESGALEGYWLQVISNPNALIPTIPWSMEAMKKGLDECDIIIIPQINDRKNRCKGANRMVEAIRSGRFVIASDMPSHEQFKEFMYIGDLREGLQWVRNNKTEIKDRVRQAQKYVAMKFNPSEIAYQWQFVLTSDVAISV